MDLNTLLIKAERALERDDVGIDGGGDLVGVRAAEDRLMIIYHPLNDNIKHLYLDNYDLAPHIRREDKLKESFKQLRAKLRQLVRDDIDAGITDL